MNNINLEAPWENFHKKVKALFELDPEIIVGDISEADDDELDYVFDIEVRNHEKYVALDRVLPNIKYYGNVTLGIHMYDEENKNSIDSGIEVYKKLFAGNPIVKDIKDFTDPAGYRHGYIRFVPEVIQFFDDNLCDYNGNWSGLAEDIAYEIFEDDYRGIYFCTADKRED